MNSTDEFRVDGSVADSRVGSDVQDAGVEQDTGPGDANSGEDAGPDVEDAGPRCLPTELEVVEPTHPPLLRVHFEDPSPCGATLQVRVGSHTQNINVGAEPGWVEFEYTGPRVPLVDGARNRVRNFIIGDARLPLLMPVERLQPVDEESGSIARSIRVAGDPHLDISNDAVVVFDSNDVNLGAESDGNIFIWQPYGRRPQNNPELPVIANIERLVENATQEQRSPVISDDSLWVAYVDVTTDEVMLQRTGDDPLARAEALVIDPEDSFGGGPTLHLDLRERNDTYLLLVRVRQMLTDFNLLYERGSSQPAFTYAELGEFGGPGLVAIGENVTGYASRSDDGLAQLYQANADPTPSPNTCMLAEDSLVHASSTGLFAHRCQNELFIDTESFMPAGLGPDAWRLISASGDHAHVLIRSEPSVTTTPYVLVSRTEDFEPSVESTPVGLGAGSQLDARPNLESFVANTTSGAALSPNGTWLTYSLVVDGAVEIYRIPVDEEVDCDCGHLP